MIVGLAVVAATLDEFLDRGGANETAERIQRIGIAMGAGGILVAAGILALVAVASMRPADRDVMLSVVGLGGLVAAFGAVVEVFGIARTLEVGWWEAFREPNGSAPMMRLLGALLLVVGAFDRADGHPGDDEVLSDDVARRRAQMPVFAVGGAVVGLLSFAFDGHTNSEGPRALHAVVDVVHVTGGGVWFGGVVALAILAVRQSLAIDGAAIVHLFAKLATFALVAVASAGVVMATFILDEVGDLTGTSWGRLLIVKVALVVSVAALGTYHHFALARWVECGPGTTSRRAILTLIVESILFVVIVGVTAALVTSSPT